MLNQVILIGRIKEFKEKKENTILTLAVPQSFKNTDGIYNTDFIDIKLFGTIASNTKEYCKTGDMIGIKARIQRIDVDEPMELIAKNVTFLSSKR